jgi:hypothetical protein
LTDEYVLTLDVLNPSGAAARYAEHVCTYSTKASLCKRAPDDGHAKGG